MTLLFLLSAQPFSFPPASNLLQAHHLLSALVIPLPVCPCLFPHQGQISLPNTGILIFNPMFFSPPTWTAPVPGSSLCPKSLFMPIPPPKLLPLISACEASQVHPAMPPLANWDPLPLSVEILCIFIRSVVCWLFV